MTLRPTHSGFEPRTQDPERRDFFDIRRRIGELESITTGAPWDFMGTINTPGPPTTVQDPLPHADGDMWIDSNGIGWVWNGTAWVNVGSIRGPAGPPGPQGPDGPQGPAGSGGTGTGTDEVWIGPDDPIIDNPTIELWIDSDEGSSGGSGGGTSGPVAYVHNQGTVAASWIIAHNLGFFPNVTVIDSGGATCEGDVAHIDANTLTIQFSGAFTGTGYLS